MFYNAKGRVSPCERSCPGSSAHPLDDIFADEPGSVMLKVVGTLINKGLCVKMYRCSRQNGLHRYILFIVSGNLQDYVAVVQILRFNP